MSSHFCFEWSFWSSLSKMSKMSIMLIMLTVIISDSSDQSNHLQDSDYSIITQSLLLYNLMQKSSNINKKVLDEMYENDESIEETSNCKCSEILKMILKKVYRKSFTVIDMMNEMKCINTLRILWKQISKKLVWCMFVINIFFVLLITLIYKSKCSIQLS